jgi:hypothetical protein
VIDKFAEQIIKDIRRQMNDTCDMMASGRCRSYEDYKYSCGVLAGLAAVEERVKELLKYTEESDE